MSDVVLGLGTPALIALMFVVLNLPELAHWVRTSYRRVRGGGDS